VGWEERGGEKEAQCREGEGHGRYRREGRRWINKEKKDGEDEVGVGRGDQEVGQERDKET